MEGAKERASACMRPLRAAREAAMVEEQVEVKVLIPDIMPSDGGDERELDPQFEEKALQFTEDCGFEVAFRCTRLSVRHLTWPSLDEPDHVEQVRSAESRAVLNGQFVSTVSRQIVLHTQPASDRGHLVGDDCRSGRPVRNPPFLYLTHGSLDPHRVGLISLIHTAKPQ
jgi:hypothetical protein